MDLNKKGSIMMARYQFVVLLVVLVLAVPCTAWASGPLATTPYAFDDGNAPLEYGSGGAWRGSSGPFYFDMMGFDTVGGSLEFAVFTTDDFNAFLVDELLPAADPAVGGLVYAYQLFITDTLNGIDLFTTGIDPGVPRTFPDYIVAGDESPIVMDDQNSSMLWNFVGNLQAGESSDILYYTSPNLPKPDNATVNSGIASVNLSPTPSPGRILWVPEPSTLVLTLIGISLILAVASRRRHASRASE